MCVEFQQVEYIHLSEIVHALKAVAVALHCDTCILKLVNNFVVSNFLGAKEPLRWMNVKLRFQDAEKVPLSPE